PEVAADVLDEEPLRAALLERAGRLVADQARLPGIREVSARALEVRDGEPVRIGILAPLTQGRGDDVLRGVGERLGQPEHLCAHPAQQESLVEVDPVLELVREHRGDDAERVGGGAAATELLAWVEYQ